MIELNQKQFSKSPHVLKIILINAASEAFTYVPILALAFQVKGQRLKANKIFKKKSIVALIIIVILIICNFATLIQR